MRLAAVWGRGVALIAAVAAACGGDGDERNNVKCGAGTVLQAGECVASSGSGGGGSEAGTDSGGSNAKAGSAGKGGASTAGDGSAGEPVGPIGGAPSPSAGGFPNGGALDPDSDAGAAGAEQVAGQAGASSTGEGGGGGDGSNGVDRSSGCGKPFSGTSGAKVTIQTSGVKDVDCDSPKCGAWSTPRDYYVYLPDNYEPSTPYNLLIEGSGCGLDGTNIQSYDFENDIHGTAIRVGLNRGPDSLSSWQTCFDVREGDDSIDFVFYEQLFDKLEAELCFDKQRVFAGGYSSGGVLANELGCKYAGDALRPIRGVLSSSAGFPPQLSQPTCHDRPVAGMWIHSLDNSAYPFETTAKPAIDYAIQANGCTSGTSYDTAALENYPINASLAADTCKKVVGCPELYPVVVCVRTGFGHSQHLDVADPGFAKLVTELPRL
jgi:polyhydroxybutyrate depolymerase